MLYRFTSAAAGEVLMLEEPAKDIFATLDRPLTQRGVIPVSDLADAMARLEVRMNHSRAQDANQPQDDKQDDSAAHKEPKVAFHARAYPFYQLLQTSAQAGKDVTWGI